MRTTSHGNGNGNGEGTSPPPDIVDHKTLLTTLLAVKKGDFSVRMPIDHVGVWQDL